MENHYGFELKWERLENRSGFELPPNLFLHWLVNFKKDDLVYSTEVSLPMKISNPSRDHIISIILLEIAAAKLDAVTYDNSFQTCAPEACHLFSKDHTELRFQKISLEKLLGTALFTSTFFPKQFPYTETTLH
jgi:hypothetical protein